MEEPDGGLEPGLYDAFVDEELAASLQALDPKAMHARLAETDPGEIPERVAELVGAWVRDGLAAAKTDARRAAALGITESVLQTLREQGLLFEGAASPLAEDLRRLQAIERVGPGGVPMPIDQPLTPLRDTVLLTNATGEASVGHEIKAEIASADAIDLVLAFIRWTGVRDLIEPLRRHVEAGKPLRIITTTYTGSTELRALEELASIGAEIKVSYWPSG